MNYKKYVVFKFNVSYPSGGIRDIELDFDTIEEVKEKFAENYYGSEIVQIVERDTWTMVEEYRTR